MASVSSYRAQPRTRQNADPGDTATAMAELCRDYYVDRIVVPLRVPVGQSAPSTPRRRTLATLWP